MTIEDNAPGERTHVEALNQLREWFGPEALDPELEGFVVTDGGIEFLKHPLVVMPFFGPTMHKSANRSLRLKREALAEARASGHWHQVVFLHERPWRAEAFHQIQARLRDEEYWELGRSVWLDTENLHEWGDLVEAFWYGRPEPQRVMEPEDRAAYDRLPDEITIYRGYCVVGAEWEGWSWTRKHARAVWFARRFADVVAGRPRVATTRVDKTDVLAYFGGRGEAEIVIDPRILHAVTSEFV